MFTSTIGIDRKKRLRSTKEDEMRMLVSMRVPAIDMNRGNDKVKVLAMSKLQRTR
jgi:hypothetical protein